MFFCVFFWRICVYNRSMSAENVENRKNRKLGRKGILFRVTSGLWRTAKSHSTAIGILLGILFLCFLMTMVAFGLILSKIQRTYAVLVMFITTFVLTIPSHYLLIRLVYRLTGKHFLDKYEREREVAALRAELAEKKQEEETRRNNNFPQERGQKVSWLPVWEQRIDQPIFDSVPYESEKRVAFDRHNILVRGAKKMYHWVVPVKININAEKEKPDKEERLYVAGHITGRRIFWVDADEIMVNIDDPTTFLVYGLDQSAIHAGFLDDAEIPSFRVDKYFSWAVSTSGGKSGGSDNIKKFELIRDDEMTVRSSRISLHWDRLVDDIKTDTSRVMNDVLSATKEKIIATLKTMDASKRVEFVDAKTVGTEQKFLTYFDLSGKVEQ